MEQGEEGQDKVNYAGSWERSRGPLIMCWSYYHAANDRVWGYGQGSGGLAEDRRREDEGSHSGIPESLQT